VSTAVTPGSGPARGLMVCGTASDVGKSVVVAGLCRLLSRRGVRVAPFKAQNMALNSFVTASGHEIGRAQAAQAMAAGIEAEVVMNPILLKPTGDGTSQVVVMGRPVGSTSHMDASAYRAESGRLLPIVLDALADLRSRYDVVICEGAGSPAEINLLDRDIVNLRVAAEAGFPALIVGDIDRGGVFASLFGTVALLPDRFRVLVRGFVVNKLRGAPEMLSPGLADLERRCGVPTLGVLPYAEGLTLDAEDSLALEGFRPPPGAAPGAGTLDVAVVRLPWIANFTDFDPLRMERGVSVRLVGRPEAMGAPDLVVLPGTKATVADLAWLRATGLAEALGRARRGGSCILGICGGYQMLGRRIVDRVESGCGEVEGLGWLDVDTRFGVTKVTRQRQGTALGERVTGYEIHHGRERPGPTARPWVALHDRFGVEPEGASDPSGQVRGTSLHGLFERDRFRTAFLEDLSRRRGRDFEDGGISFDVVRQAHLDRLADLLEAHLDLAAVERIIAGGAVGLGAGGRQAGRPAPAGLPGPAGPAHGGGRRSYPDSQPL
jgi:adenosylcobyric acid synthase